MIDIPVSLTNKNDRHDINEILLKVVLNTITTPRSSINTGAQFLNVVVSNYYYDCTVCGIARVRDIYFFHVIFHFNFGRM
jgi:hypothetical protein